MVRITPRKRFAQEHSITTRQVRNLQKLVDLYAIQDANDVNTDATVKQLTALVKQLGFDGLDFRSGLYPTLIKGGDNFITVPD